MENKACHLTIETDNLAVPEIHTHEPIPDDIEAEEETGIAFDNLAMPEIHISRKMQKQDDN